MGRELWQNSYLACPWAMSHPPSPIPALRWLLGKLWAEQPLCSLQEQWASSVQNYFCLHLPHVLLSAKL